VLLTHFIGENAMAYQWRNNDALRVALSECRHIGGSNEFATQHPTRGAIADWK
jgi:hypothetical protein